MTEANPSLSFQDFVGCIKKGIAVWKKNVWKYIGLYAIVFGLGAVIMGIIFAVFMAKSGLSMQDFFVNFLYGNLEAFIELWPVAFLAILVFIVLGTMLYITQHLIYKNSESKEEISIIKLFFTDSRKYFWGLFYISFKQLFYAIAPALFAGILYFLLLLGVGYLLEEIGRPIRDDLTTRSLVGIGLSVVIILSFWYKFLRVILAYPYYILSGKTTQQSFNESFGITSLFITSLMSWMFIAWMGLMILSGLINMIDGLTMGYPVQQALVGQYSVVPNTMGPIGYVWILVSYIFITPVFYNTLCAITEKTHPMKTGNVTPKIDTE